mmetsp:Transcript_15531/g.33551  ORF Transcript_15531/g.33551 Transcript_15531/m.33551 type:complete len:84 (+) Transcript_15531:707-958(+)
MWMREAAVGVMMRGLRFRWVFRWVDRGGGADVSEASCVMAADENRRAVVERSQNRVVGGAMDDDDDVNIVSVHLIPAVPIDES